MMHHWSKFSHKYTFQFILLAHTNHKLYIFLAPSKYGIRSYEPHPLFLSHCRDVGAHAELCSKAAGPGVGYQLSFSPLSWRQLCLLSSERAVLWTLEQCASQTLLTSL